MDRYELNIEQSKRVYEECKPYIEFKMCYKNVFHCVTDFNSKFRSGEWKVAYGYVEAIAGVYCRHCFIIDENNKVIDPTIFTNTDTNYHRTYLLLKAFDDVDEYLAAIEWDNLMPALEGYLQDDTKEAYKWAENKGYILIG